MIVVPWNRGGAYGEVDGELPEFDVKHGPGRRLTAGEMEDIATREVPWIVHRAHLRRTDFDKFGFTDKCPGCMAIIQGRRVQPHAPHCRERMEKLLKDDLRIKNAKARLDERSRKRAEEVVPGVVPEQSDAGKRRLDDPEQAVRERDSEKLATLSRNKVPKKQRTLDDIEDECMRTEDPKRSAELFEEYARESKRQKGSEAMQEVASGSTGAARYEEMFDRMMEPYDPTEAEEMAIDRVADIGLEADDDRALEEYAWDDVNDMELPLDMVRAARKEEMEHMKGRIFKVVKREEAERVTGRRPISTKWVDTDKTHGT